jgi:hypothetical protein
MNKENEIVAGGDHHWIIVLIESALVSLAASSRATVAQSRCHQGVINHNIYCMSYYVCFAVFRSPVLESSTYFIY